MSYKIILYYTRIHIKITKNNNNNKYKMDASNDANADIKFKVPWLDSSYLETLFPLV